MIVFPGTQPLVLKEVFIEDIWSRKYMIKYLSMIDMGLDDDVEILMSDPRFGVF